jgi:hypothetical protein
VIRKRVRLGDLSELAFEYFGDPGMKRSTRLAQQHAIGGVLHQRMFEQVALGGTTCRNSKPAAMRRSSADVNAASYPGRITQT